MHLSSARAVLLGIVATLAAPAAAHAGAPPDFAASQLYSGFTQAYGVAHADITRDGVGDAIVADRSNATVSVLAGAPGGTFGPPTATAVGTLPEAVAVGDFNGDGHPDVATANYSGTISVALNTGSALAASTSFGANAATFDDMDRVSDLVVGDFNGDGRDDLAASGSSGSGTPSGRLLVAFSAADGSFPAADVTTYDIGSNRSGWSIAAGDVDEDGKLDLITANFGRQDLTYFRNQGAGTFTDTPTLALTAGSATAAVELADVDGDGHLDAAFTYSTADVGLFRGHGDGTFDATPVTQHDGTGQQPYELAIGDVDGDGRPDAVTADFGSRRFGVWPNVAGSFGAALGFEVGEATEGVNYPSGVALADVDGDGRLDVLTTVAYSASGGLTVRRNTTPRPAAATTHSVVTEITPTSAKVAATVSSADSDGTWRLGYGTTSTPSLFTSDQALTANSGPQHVEAVLTGLTPATTYHVRALVTDAAGETAGADVTFTTAPKPADPDTGTPGDTPGTPGTPGAPPSTGADDHPAPNPPVTAGPQPVPSTPATPAAAPQQVRSDQARVITATARLFGGRQLATLLAGRAVGAPFVAREPGTLTVSAEAPAARTASAAAKRKPVRLLSGRRTFKRAGTATIPIKLTAKGRAMLRTGRTLTVVVTTTWKGAGGQTITTKKTITLKAKRPARQRGR